MRKNDLYQKIVSSVNIYNAIYSLESYVFEKGLLSAEDIELYTALSDKFDFVRIEQVIKECRGKLKKILKSDNLFEIKVYFKIKKFDDNGEITKYRPIHTADLVTQICIVCILNVLMFEDDCSRSDMASQKTRVLSDLSKLIPSNFYGNIPSTRIEELFCDWKHKYKEYSDAVINKYYNYAKTQEYTYEVCLDIKEFFPSINPQLLYQYIIDKLLPHFDKDDANILRIAVSKLLYFKVTNLDKEWMSDYYGDDHNLNPDQPMMARGIPQGLPQAFFFGNLYMIEVAKCIKRFIPGDACYYVDDSVIYTNSKTVDIDKLNEALANIKWTNRASEHPEVLKKYLNACNQIPYCVSIYPFNEKSSLTSIFNAHKDVTLLRSIAGLTSHVNSALYLSIDDLEDITVENKIKSLIEVIGAEIESINDSLESKSDQYYRKLLVRYKKFFLFRQKLINQRISYNENATKEVVKSFLEKYGITSRNIRKFFSAYEEDIFYAELSLLLQDKQLGLENAQLKKIFSFEKFLTKKKTNTKSQVLYLSKDIEGQIYLREQKPCKYTSLIRWVEKEYPRLNKQTKEQLIKRLPSPSLIIEECSFFNYAECSFVAQISDEFNRLVINSVYSQIINVYVSDDLIFQKRDNRSLQYYELRLLLWLRNKSFKTSDFAVFYDKVISEVKSLKGADIVDYNLLEVLYIFVAKVKDPNNIDSIILVHKLVNGLWKNGSKFLHFYTLHNEEHSIELIKNVVKIINTIDYLTIKKLDYYVLFLACYLHDISMVIHPDLNKFCISSKASDNIYSQWMKDVGTELFRLSDYSTQEVKKIILDYFKRVFDYFEIDIRNNHANESALFIKEKHDTEYLKHINTAVLDIVAEISASHGYNSTEVYGRKASSKDDFYSKKYMMILIRLADLLDMSKERVSYYILKENIAHMSLTSQFHWISHLITDTCVLEAKYEIPKKRKDPELRKGVIEETIYFNLYVNVKHQTSFPSRKCKFRDCIHKSKQLNITINMTSCRQRECTLLCSWMAKKHEYLFNELYALNKYLDTVNSGLFKTKFCVNIIYDDRKELDPEFRDIIFNYLEENKN